MKNKDLVTSGVRFDERTHTYDFNGKPLRGVTPIVEWVFPRTYEGIPEHVLHRAAEYGSAVHKACELFDDCGVTMADYADEVARYDALCKENGLKPIVSEYLVSDEQDIASSIDRKRIVLRIFGYFAKVRFYLPFHKKSVSLHPHPLPWW